MQQYKSLLEDGQVANTYCMIMDSNTTAIDMKWDHIIVLDELIFIHYLDTRRCIRRGKNVMCPVYTNSYTTA